MAEANRNTGRAEDQRGQATRGQVYTTYTPPQVNLAPPEPPLPPPPVNRAVPPWASEDRLLYQRAKRQQTLMQRMAEQQQRLQQQRLIRNDVVTARQRVAGRVDEPGFRESFTQGLGAGMQPLIQQGVETAQRNIVPDVRVENYRDQAIRELRAEKGYAAEAEVRQRAYDLATAQAERQGRGRLIPAQSVDQQFGGLSPTAQIQPLRRVESAVSGGLRRAGEATGIPGAGAVGEKVGQYAIPTTLLEAELALVPGFTLADDIKSAAQLLKSGGDLAVPVIRRLERSEAGQNLLRRLASETGAQGDDVAGKTPEELVAAARAGGAVGGSPAVAGTQLPPSPVPQARELELTPVEHLRMALKSVGQAGLGETARARTDELKHTELAKRFAALRSRLANATSEAESAAARSEMAGLLPVETFQSLRGLMDQSTIDELFGMINHSSLPEGNKLHAQAGLWTLLDGKPPQPSQIRDMEAAGLGVREFIPRNQREWDAWRIAGEVANLPRSLTATADLSASLRQAIFALPSHPKEYGSAFVAQAKAFTSESRAVQIEDALRGHRLRPIMDEVGVYFAPVSDVAQAGLTKREEQFMSHLPTKIPLFGRLARASERGYATMLNKLRADVFTTIYDNWEEAKIPLTRDRLENLARFVNNMTGRGSLGKADDAAPVLNALFFSPRFQLSRAQLVADLLRPTQDEFVRKQAIRDWIAFVGTGMTALALADLSPWLDVEVDPRNARFGQVRLGNTTFDFWAGFQQPARYTAQLISGQRRVTAQNGVYTVDASSWQDRANIVGRFVRTKLAPVPGGFVDVMAQSQISGQPNTIKSLVLDRVTPLAWQDLYEAVLLYRNEGPAGLAKMGAVGALGFFGAGSQSYRPSEDAKDKAEAKGERDAAKKRLAEFPLEYDGQEIKGGMEGVPDYVAGLAQSAPPFEGWDLSKDKSYDDLVKHIKRVAEKSDHRYQDTDQYQWLEQRAKEIRLEFRKANPKLDAWYSIVADAKPLTQEAADIIKKETGLTIEPQD